MRILIVEDNAIDLKLVRAVLNEAGIDACELACAEGAIVAVRSHRPDVILLDLNLCGRDGLWLVSELRQRWDTRHIPIVAITAYPLRYEESAVIAAGCAKCIVKPIDTRALVTQLRAVIGHRPTDGAMP
jgi:CheY-like chemotaxis protein